MACLDLSPRKVLSYSSASRTKVCPSPTTAPPSSQLATSPPTMAVTPPSASGQREPRTSATMAVVVVLPWVPATDTRSWPDVTRPSHAPRLYRGML